MDIVHVFRDQCQCLDWPAQALVVTEAEYRSVQIGILREELALLVQDLNALRPEDLANLRCLAVTLADALRPRKAPADPTPVVW